MSDEELEREVLGEVGEGRRAFLKKLIVGAAFAAPAVASFTMVTSPTASGGEVGNQTDDDDDDKDLDIEDDETKDPDEEGDEDEKDELDEEDD